MKSSLGIDKIKLVYSFNGKFRRQGPENKLRYTGGETKMVSVDPTTLDYSTLRSVISERVNLDVFTLKYRVPGTESSGGGEVPLVVVASDEDVTCMVEEFEDYYCREKKFSNNFFRVWVYVCCSNDHDDYDDEDEFFGSFSEKSGDFRVLGKNFDSSLEGRDNNQIRDRNHVNKSIGCGKRINNNRSKKSSRNEKDCLRKVVLKQQLMLARQRDQIQGYLGQRLGPNYMVRSCYYDQPSIDLGFDTRKECQDLMNTETSVEFLQNHHGWCNSISEAISINVSPYDSSQSSFEISGLSCLRPEESRGLDVVDVVEERGGVKKNMKEFVEEIIAKLDVSSLEQVKRNCTSATTDDDDDEKVDIRTDVMYSNVPVGVMGDLATFYTQLATRGLQIIKDADLEYVTKFCSGNCGTVYHSKWKGSGVAIKKLHPSHFNQKVKEDERLLADFWKEAHLLSQLHHPNIVAFYRVIIDGPITNFALVTKYMVSGSLKQVLQKKVRTIDRGKRIIIAVDAAFGMEYLHEKNIVHFDFESHNFLLRDLGLSKVQRALVSRGVHGTIPWMAPELLIASANLVLKKVDVFGVVMWELFTGEEPYVDVSAAEIIAGVMKGGHCDLTSRLPSWCNLEWRLLKERCWSLDPYSWPHFSEIAKRLRDMSTRVYIK